MKVVYVNDNIPRSDGRKGKPTSMTIGKTYLVAEVLDEQYSVINDDYKIARYNKERFEVVDDEPIKPLRQAFNELTKDMRMELKQLKSSK